MSCPRIGVPIISSEVHIREGAWAEGVGPVSDVVMTGNVDESSADCSRRICFVQIELAIAKHDLVVVAEVLIDSDRSGILVGSRPSRIEEICAIHRSVTAGGNDLLVCRGNWVNPRLRNAVDVATA